MNNLAVMSSTLVLVGAVFMAAAIINGRKIQASVPAELQRKWLTMISFMIVFLAGYLTFAAVLLGNLRLPHELVTSPIFLGGAIFVFIVVSLTRSTIGRMKGAEEKLRLLNESLEQKDLERTRELMEAQEELLRREKLGMLGVVAEKVGNELRNPLGVVSNAVFFLESQLTDADASVREYLEIIRTEIDGSQRVLSDFIDFFRASPPRLKEVPVEELINESLAGYEMPEYVTVRVELPETLPMVKVDPSQMRQVFQNLIANAVQAMPEGGTLRIGARRVQGPRSKVPGYEEKNLEPGALSFGPDADSVEIRVADGGAGISPENMEKVFQPLFSTKSRGIGLGLSICKSFVEANGGRIELESEVGMGTSFGVVLPVERREEC
jgi:signal transduction histidine kinase